MRKEYDSHYEEIYPNNISKKIKKYLNNILEISDNNNSKYNLIINLYHNLDEFIIHLEQTDIYLSHNKELFNNPLINSFITEIQMNLINLFKFKKYQGKLNQQQIINYIKSFKDQCFKTFFEKNKKIRGIQTKLDQKIIKLINDSLKKIKDETNVIVHLINSEELRNNILNKIKNSFENEFPNLNVIQLSIYGLKITNIPLNGLDEFTKRKISSIIERIETEINLLYKNLVNCNVSPKKALSIICKKGGNLLDLYLKENNKVNEREK